MMSYDEPVWPLKFGDIWWIQDAKHQKNIVAGTQYGGEPGGGGAPHGNPGNVYHQAQDSRPEGIWAVQWFDELTGEFFLRDLRHGKFLYAGDGNNDRWVNNMYHVNTPREAGQTSMYAVFYQFPKNTAFSNLKDKGAGRCVVAGEEADNHVYHQDDNGRQNAQWSFTKATSNIAFPVPRLAARNNTDIKYTINTGGLSGGLSSEEIATIIKNSWAPWVAAFQQFGINISATPTQADSQAHVKFSWGKVDQSNNTLTYTRAAQTKITGGAGKWSEGSLPYEVVFSEDCTWKDLSKQISSLASPTIIQ